jgi:hypothetical protein
VSINDQKLLRFPIVLVILVIHWFIFFLGKFLFLIEIETPQQIMATILHLPLPYPSAPRSFPTARPAACRAIGRYVSPGVSSNVVGIICPPARDRVKIYQKCGGVSAPPPGSDSPGTSSSSTSSIRLLLYGQAIQVLEKSVSCLESVNIQKLLNISRQSL